MELKMKDVTEILQASEKEVLELIKKNGLPAHKISHQYLFNKQELKEWVLKTGRNVSEKFLDLKLADIPVSITALLTTGGCLEAIPGNRPAEILSAAVAKMALPAELKKETVLNSLLEREDMMPTAVGRGISIPHPRNPVITEAENESVTLCRLATPVDYGAMDGVAVHSLFIVLSSTPRRHLEILSKLLYMCQREEFTQMLKNGAPFQEILSYAGRTEKELTQRKK